MISNIFQENHPLNPFLPVNAKVLLLGSFPPQKKRWSMDFFYPNLNNDMWRIFGIVFFGGKNHFLTATKKAFYKEKIIEFLTEKGIALYDAATVVRRLNNNASDKFLEVVEATDIKALLVKIPRCTAIAVTGQKAADIFLQQFHLKEPKTGEFTCFIHNNQQMQLFRMPSSSRAYPLKIEQKAKIYGEMFEKIGIV
ncbi:MAG: uracil-DNA glycosylase family protein [Prevotellaceae bacterium]|jgi:G:T/U-mismatch repair DNA glycosylase|nr:uracil-DNA glycosylase family protein [Prevotellaceae bacterium]